MGTDRRSIVAGLAAGIVMPIAFGATGQPARASAAVLVPEQPRKFLWCTVVRRPDLFLDHAQRMGAHGLVVRTDNGWLLRELPNLKRLGLTVYGWRWPSIVVAEAETETHRIRSLASAGLDGYVVDIEAHDNKLPHYNWDQPGLQPAAERFCENIQAIKSDYPTFHRFGFTGAARGARSARIPYAEFLASADVVYPQAYWYNTPLYPHRRTPVKSFEYVIENWRTILPAAKPFIPILGNLPQCTPAEIGDAWENIVKARSMAEAHFYPYSDVTKSSIPESVWAKLESLT
jgi:hypothetical protein